MVKRTIASHIVEQEEDDEDEEPGEVIESAPPLKVGDEREINSSGLKKKLLKRGSGWETPELGDEVTVRYVGILPDGTKLVSSGEDAPFTFKLGHGVGKGFDNGIITMKKGEIAIFTLPPDTGFGGSVADGVSQNSVVQFEVELVSWMSIVDVFKDGGIIKKILRKGESGRQPSDLDEVLVKYQVMLHDGTIVSDTTEGSIEFYLKDGHLISVLPRVIKTMTVGHVLTNLSATANTTQNGFYSVTVPSTGAGSSKIYGLYFCRGDENRTGCSQCITSGVNEFPVSCPQSNEAIIWYDECTLRYSIRNIFSTVQLSPTLPLSNTQNATNATQFAQVVKATLDAASTEAAQNSGKKYATKEVKISSDQTLYCLVQCTPDLSVGDCTQCLNYVKASLELNKIGSRFLAPSCNGRFELYPFYNLVSNVEAPAPSPGVALVPALAPKALVVPASGGIKISQGKKSLSKVVVGVIVGATTVGLTVLLTIFICLFKRKKDKQEIEALTTTKASDDFTAPESLQYGLDTLQVATNNFSDENKIGQGGFGSVYKGVMPNGKKIAVKRLSKNSSQGIEQFKNEVVLVAKLQHRNLVRLLGFCLAGDEKLLVYEYVANKSLDSYIFDPERQRYLNWSIRYEIIQGTARGMLYLHEDSRLRIIHRDLKASNVLLDADLNPKISDFGMARIFEGDQTHENTSKVVGTFGYMSPEYAMHGQFSMKSDVYSFGVMVLEIISGKRNSGFYISDYAEDLLTYAWKLWNEGRQFELLDPTLRDSYTNNEVIRCIEIGLLCVQDNLEERPSMATVVHMLDDYSITVNAPLQPAFFIHSRIYPDLSTDRSTSRSVTVNEVSITEIGPR